MFSNHPVIMKLNNVFPIKEFYDEMSKIIEHHFQELTNNKQ